MFFETFDITRQVWYDVFVQEENMQLLKLITLALQVLRNLYKRAKEFGNPVIFLTHAAPEERDKLILSLKGNVTISESESDANVCILSKTDIFGVTYSNGKILVYLPLRNGANDVEIDYAVSLVISLLNYTGRK